MVEPDERVNQSPRRQKMKKAVIVLVAITAGTLMAGPHHAHHHGNNGVRLATDIVNLVGAGLRIINPRPVVVAAPTVAIPAYGYTVWNGVHVPYYNGFCYTNNAWLWIGHGRPPAPPRWRPAEAHHHHGRAPHAAKPAPEVGHRK